MNIFGSTRSRITRDHALITPDTHVSSPLVGWENTSATIHISPEIGARFTQYTACLEGGGTSGTPGGNVQRLIYVLDGSVAVKIKGQDTSLVAGGFAYMPAGIDHTISAQETSTLIVFEKTYIPIEGFSHPEPIVGNANQVDGEPFMEDPDAMLKTLLPISPEFDMAVNIFTYQPGATLPQVEVHVMEHGLQMIAGQGVYRLSDSYYPVCEGDIIWMASYCPQWFVAMGKTSASYIYYKDIHRDRLSDRQRSEPPNDSLNR